MAFLNNRNRLSALEEEAQGLRLENARLKGEVERLSLLASPESKAIEQLATQQHRLEESCERSASELRKLFAEKQNLLKQIETLNSAICVKQNLAKELEAQVETFEEEILVQQFGLYQPRYEFANSLAFKNALIDVRATQKLAIAEFNKKLEDTHWTVNNSTAKGRKMVKDVGRLLMRAYNSECDDIIRKVKYSNIDKSITEIRKRGEIINRYGTVLQIEIPRSYIELKVQEAQLAFEWAVQKEKEKEEIREERERRREEAKLKREIAEERRKLKKEREHYLHAYRDITSRLTTASDEERPSLEERAEEIKGHLSEIDRSFENIDYREANQRAGFVYVISNIGSFGKDVYKIGMTRRLDPTERVRELSDASVPFNFDIHAMIFSDDAPSLEAALHREFSDRKINLVNTRREFFACTLEEIEEVVKRNYDKTVEFVNVPDAEQFRISREMRSQAGVPLHVDRTE